MVITINVVVVGLGYVGTSLSVLLSQKNHVVAVDISKEKVNKLNNKISPIKDNDVQYYLQNKKLDLHSSLSYKGIYSDADVVLIAVPTNYNDSIQSFDTSIVENVISNIKKENKYATIVIKSTVPIGFTDKMNNKYSCNNIVFSPEFLREGKALEDNLRPSRIIVGGDIKIGKEFVDMMLAVTEKKNVSTMCVSASEAESIKLFSNAFLALRVAFFNEVDTFTEMNGLDTNNVINGICLDDRIGNYYNNPSFGYGGYCLPKDTKQLKNNYGDIPQNLISAVIDSNATRKNFIVEQIVAKNPKVVGIYGLGMKEGSDNYRESSILDIVKGLKERVDSIIIHEPTYKEKDFKGCEVINNLSDFKKRSDIIVANRTDNLLADIEYKLYTRDLFTRD